MRYRASFGPQALQRRNFASLSTVRGRRRPSPHQLAPRRQQRHSRAHVSRQQLHLHCEALRVVAVFLPVSFGARSKKARWLRPETLHPCLGIAVGFGAPRLWGGER
jgi:hypothetical protein